MESFKNKFNQFNVKGFLQLTIERIKTCHWFRRKIFPAYLLKHGLKLINDFINVNGVLKQVLSYLHFHFQFGSHNGIYNINIIIWYRYMVVCTHLPSRQTVNVYSQISNLFTCNFLMLLISIKSAKLNLIFMRCQITLSGNDL